MVLSLSMSPNITRWITILKSSLQNRDVVQPPDLSKTLGQHRNWIVDCLRAIDLKRSGKTIQIEHWFPKLEIAGLAAQGASIANAVWAIYLQYVFGNTKASDVLSQAITRLNPTALIAGINDNPEPWWANELLILHALQSFAFLDGRVHLQEKLDACINFHLAEIQPDHATNEPWAIHAFAAHANGNVTAETLLHAGMVHGGGQLTHVAQLIVADALHSLEAKASRA